MTAPRITGDTLSLARLESLWSRIFIPVLPNGHPDFDACWPWLGLIAPNGYGCIVWGVDGRQVRLTPHRLVNEQATRAPIPPGVQIDHLCNCRVCCNPHHHERVDHATNIARQRDPSRIPWREARDRALAHAHIKECFYA